MSVTPLSDRSESELVLDLLMNSLRVREARLNEVASELLTRFGTLPIRRLVVEAVREKNRPDHRIRALEVLARIGPPYGLEMMDLSLLLRARNPSVRAAARKIFGCDALAGVPSDNVGPVLRT